MTELGRRRDRPRNADQAGQAEVRVALRAKQHRRRMPDGIGEAPHSQGVDGQRARRIASRAITVERVLVEYARIAFATSGRS